MATAVGSSSRMVGNGYTTKRTEAMPKSSLFGSILEIQDGEGVRSLDVTKVTVPKTPPAKGKGQMFELPEEVKRGLPGAIVLEKSRRAVDNQKGVAESARDSLKQKEAEVLYKLTQGSDEHCTTEAPQTSRSQWFTGKDLEGSREINIVGLNKGQSYNRDKYGRRAPIHSYSLLGDILKPGMDFTRRERTDIQMRNQGYGKGDLKGPLVDGMMPPAKGNASARTSRCTGAVVNIPPNIKHQYGSRVCDNLLSDKDVVEHTLRKQEDIKASTQRRSQQFKVPTFSKELNPEYEMLGNALRMNVAPGYSVDNKISTTKSSYNDQVHLFREKDPDKWRYQKDELSTWSEQQFIHKRLTQSWKEMLDNAPKLERNWNPADYERTKTAPASNTKSQKKTVPRSKPKTAPSKKSEQQNEAAFEDVVFETPPITPPPKTPEKIKSMGQKRDSEFWNMYDTGID